MASPKPLTCPMTSIAACTRSVTSAAGSAAIGTSFRAILFAGGKTSSVNELERNKRSHALAAVDEGIGRVRGSRQIKADESGHLAAVRWARELDDERVWAIEDCRSVSGRLEQALIAAGEQVVRVAPHRMGASRRGERRPGKSDEIDALAIARAVVKDGIEDFPAAHLDEQAMEIRLLSNHRKDLVAERTRVQNRLRWHLLELCGDLEQWLGRGALERPQLLSREDAGGANPGLRAPQRLRLALE
jgi:transposase